MLRTILRAMESNTRHCCWALEKLLTHWLSVSLGIPNKVFWEQQPVGNSKLPGEPILCWAWMVHLKKQTAPLIQT